MSRRVRWQAWAFRRKGRFGALDSSLLQHCSSLFPFVASSRFPKGNRAGGLRGRWTGKGTILPPRPPTERIALRERWGRGLVPGWDCRLLSPHCRLFALLMGQTGREERRMGRERLRQDT